MFVAVDLLWYYITCVFALVCSSRSVVGLLHYLRVYVCSEQQFCCSITFLVCLRLFVPVDLLLYYRLRVYLRLLVPVALLYYYITYVSAFVSEYQSLYIHFWTGEDVFKGHGSTPIPLTAMNNY